MNDVPHAMSEPGIDLPNSVSPSQAGTERDRDELETLRRARFTLDHQSLPIGWLDETAQFRYVNDAYSKLLGYEKREFLRMTVHDLDPEYPKEAWEAFIERLKQTGNDVFESTNQAKDGTPIPVEIHANYFDPDRAEQGWICAQVLDLRERNRLADSLKDMELRASAILNTSYQLIGLLGPEGEVLSSNTAALSMIGVTLEDVYGVPFWDCPWWLHDREMAQKLQEMFARTVRGEQTRFYGTHKTPDGSLRHIDLSMTPIFDDDGEVVFVVPEGHDVTELKETEQELLQAKEAAETANRSKSVFLANMSHELRTPLNAILGFTQLMQRDHAIPENRREELGIIGRSGNHLLGLINDVLDIAKIEAGHVKIEPKPFDLKQFLRGIGEIFHSRAQSKDLSFVEEVDPKVPWYIVGDEGKLRQVLINLLGNAIKFTEAGVVTLRTQVLGTKTSENDETDRVLVRFEVEDSGIGISDDQIGDVFDPFVQAGLRTGETTGTGLGLAISRQYVELMGGEIAAESELGKGSFFHFEIPVEPTVADKIVGGSESRRVIGLAPGQDRRRILVVEDREESRVLLAKLLEVVGFEACTACNGKEAVDVFREGHPDLVWMDMRMPVMDGIEATQKIRETVEGKSTPIIALTAHAFEEERQEFLKSGCDDFVRKPYEESEIFEKIAKHLGVEYVYEEPEDASSAAEMPELTPADLADLPREVVADLHRMAVRGAVDDIEQLIKQIRSDHPKPAKAISRLMASFEFNPIIAATANCKEETKAVT